MLRLALLLAALLVAPAAWGNAGAIPAPSELSALGTASRTPIEVAHERLTITCGLAGRGFGLLCAFEARYELVNPTPQRQDVVASFFWLLFTRVESATLDGVDVRAQLSGEEQEALRARLAEVDSAAWLPTARDGMRFGLDGGSSAALVLRGAIEARDLRWKPGYEVPAAYTRHPLLGARERGPGEQYVIEYYVAPMWTWAGRPDLEVQLVGPAGYEGAGQWHYPAGTAPRTLSLRLEKTPLAILPGGLLVGVGGSLGPDSGLRLKAGVELARPDWLLYSLAWETDARRRQLVVPTVMAATPSVWVLPSAGLGVGVPVELAPDARVGARLTLDLHFSLLGLVGALDVFPGDGTVQGLLLGQIGL